MAIVLVERGAQDKVLGDPPRTFLQTIALPVHEVLGALATASQVEDLPGGVGRTVDDPRQRRCRVLRRQRRKENRLEKVENCMNTVFDGRSSEAGHCGIPQTD